MQVLISPMDFKDYLPAFLSDAKEQMNIIRTSLDALKKNGSDAEALAALHRGFHTLGGTSGTMKLNALCDLARAQEAETNTFLQSGTPVTEVACAAFAEAMKKVEVELRKLGAKQ